MALNFQSAFCQHFGCSPKEYERGLFRRGFYLHARLLSPVLRRFDPHFFDEDLAVVRDLAEMTNREVIDGELSFFHGRNVRDKNWLRRTLLLRLSVAKLRRVCTRVCRTMPQADASFVLSNRSRTRPAEASS